MPGIDAPGERADRWPKLTRPQTTPRFGPSWLLGERLPNPSYEEIYATVGVMLDEGQRYI